MMNIKCCEYGPWHWFLKDMGILVEKTIYNIFEIRFYKVKCLALPFFMLVSKITNPTVPHSVGRLLAWRYDTEHKGFICDTQHSWHSINDTQHYNTLPLYWVSRFIYYHSECRYAQCWWQWPLWPWYQALDWWKSVINLICRFINMPFTVNVYA